MKVESSVMRYNEMLQSIEFEVSSLELLMLTDEMISKESVCLAEMKVEPASLQPVVRS